MLIKGMLEVNPARRLGNLKDGLSAVPGSVWFQATKFEWAALSSRTIKTPYQPPVKDAKDTSNIDAQSDEERIPKYLKASLAQLLVWNPQWFGSSMVCVHIGTVEIRRYSSLSRLCAEIYNELLLQTSAISLAQRHGDYRYFFLNLPSLVV